ncbi:MAG: helix-turn-helix transcriptional regulator [Polyangiaceae bacterium]|nr:helix-turn-helix transcriptional regulator [Polyangiaceae bacterium]
MKDVALLLAERVRELRKSAELTQATLALRAGVTVETVARLERVVRDKPSANANPSLDTLVRLSAALGVDVAELFVAPTRPKQREDRLSTLLRGASPATRQRVLRIAETLVREDAAEESAEPRSMRRRLPG